MVVLATVATVIASQAVISGAFSVTQQVIQLGFLPRMSIRPRPSASSGRSTSRRELALARVGHRARPDVPVADGAGERLGIALSAIFATNTLLAFVVFRMLLAKAVVDGRAGRAFFISIELTFFAANLTKILSGGWFPLVVGAIFFTILTTWHRGRLTLARAMKEDRSVAAPLHQPDDQRAAQSHPGQRGLPAPSLDTVPTALLNNAEHNGIVHEHVVLVKIHTVGVPHVEDAERITVEKLRLGFVAVTARYGYQDEPDVVAALELATRTGAGARPRPHLLLRRSRDDPPDRQGAHGRLAEAPLRPPAPELDPGSAVVPHPARPRVRGRRVRRALNSQLPRYHEALAELRSPRRPPPRPPRRPGWRGAPVGYFVVVLAIAAAAPAPVNPMQALRSTGCGRSSVPSAPARGAG